MYDKLVSIFDPFFAILALKFEKSANMSPTFFGKKFCIVSKNTKLADFESHSKKLEAKNVCKY